MFSRNPFDEVLLNPVSRRDKTVQRIKRDRAVFCAFTTQNATLLPDKPAGNRQLTHTISEAGLLAGLLALLHGHHLRRGLADTAILDAKVRGVATEAVANALRLSDGSHSSNVTRHYVGSLRDEVWTKRLAENFEGTFDIDATNALYNGRSSSLGIRSLNYAISRV